MKTFIAIVLIVGAVVGGWQIYSYWVTVRGKQKTESSANAAPPVSNAQLPGLPPTLESTLDAAQRQGATGLRNFLARYNQAISDPRRAAIELDYAVLVAQKDPGEAKRVFAKVKQRTPVTSPVYERVKQLEKTYE